MKEEFNSDEAKKFLQERENKKKEQWEKERQAVLLKVTSILREEFQKTKVEVYLVGSILRPFQFSPHSDVDIVLKNYEGDRFELWPQLEKKIGRSVEIIFFEKCHFQEFVLKEGLKVV